MADLKVRVFKGNDAQPATTVTIPGGTLKIARNLVPQRAMAALRDQGVDLDEIVRLSEEPAAKASSSKWKTTARMSELPSLWSRCRCGPEFFTPRTA